MIHFAVCVLQDARSKMLEVLDKAMRAQADERDRKMEKLEEKYGAASKKRQADLAKQQKELPPPAFVAYKVGGLGRTWALLSSLSV